MNLLRAFAGGLSFGGAVGIAYGVAVLLISGGSFAAVVPTLMAATLSGAAIFGVAFAAMHAITHTIPHGAEITGIHNDKERIAGLGPTVSVPMRGNSVDVGAINKSDILKAEDDYLKLDYVRDNHAEELEAQRLQDEMDSMRAAQGR